MRGTAAIYAMGRIAVPAPPWNERRCDVADTIPERPLQRPAKLLGDVLSLDKNLSAQLTSPVFRTSALCRNVANSTGGIRTIPKPGRVPLPPSRMAGTTSTASIVFAVP